MNWKITGWSLVGISTVVIVVILTAIFVTLGWGDEGFAEAIRWTARTSFVLFLTAFSASALRALMPSPKTRWLLVNRRYFGVSFAISHLFHAAAILGRLAVGDGLEDRTLAGAAPGGAVYLFILFMLATSFDRSAAWVGPRVWRVMHTLGSYLVFFSFLNAYGLRAIYDPWHLVYVIPLLTVLGLRIRARFGEAKLSR